MNHSPFCSPAPFGQGKNAAVKQLLDTKTPYEVLTKQTIKFGRIS